MNQQKKYRILIALGIVAASSVGASFIVDTRVSPMPDSALSSYFDTVSIQTSQPHTLFEWSVKRAKERGMTKQEWVALWKNKISEEPEAKEKWDASQ